MDKLTATHSFTVFPSDLNYAGSLFGGKVMQHMDLAVMIKRANENGIGTLDHFIDATEKTLNSLRDGTEEKS